MKASTTQTVANPLQSSVQTLKGVGPSVAEKLEKLDIRTVADLLFHLPLRYQDRTRIVPIGSLRDGMEISVQGEIVHSEVVYRRRRMLLCSLTDGTGSLTLRFFHFGESQRKALKVGAKVRCFGEARRGFDRLEMVHPEFQYNPAAEAENNDGDLTLTPLYPVTEGVHQLTLRRLMEQALAQVQDLVELIPEALHQPGNSLGLAEAIDFIHRPAADVDLNALMLGQHPAQQRLALEELVAHQLSMLQLRQSMDSQSGIAFHSKGLLAQQFTADLPFQLTAAQQRVVAEIQADLQQPRPMMRLLQGDVGSGKTVVAALACLACVEAGYQAVVMAPTEILAEQHRQNLTVWFEPLGVATAWISGKQKAAQRRDMLERVATGMARVIIGTHALFQEETEFPELALVVIDEQHRFGVHQRMALRDKAKSAQLPHQLIMTATPIPRTLAQTAYADLDLSIIDELPPGRMPINTVAMANERRAEVVEHVANACREGRQCYWVCTLVEQSEALDAEAAEVTFSGLQEALPDLCIGLVHGRMKPAEKESVMAAFKQAEIQLLVATTVIEVGVDVPNASLMIIENAERLGLSQLHQLRGRVGRGEVASACLLMYQLPLSQNGKQRINAMRKTDDGFEIARIDMEIRGPGELLGVRQTGLMKFRVADLNRDVELVPQAVRVAQHLLVSYPEAVQPLVDRWIGSKAQYREV